MKRHCPETHRVLRALDGKTVSDEEMRATEEHLDHCPTCRAQWSVARQLDELFGEIPPPRLSDHFDQKLRQALSRRRSRRPEPRVRRLVMHAYWLTAALVSLLILLRLGWPEGLVTMPGLLGLTLLGTLFAAPLVLFPRRFKMGLTDLIRASLSS